MLKPGRLRRRAIGVAALSLGSISAMARAADVTFTINTKESGGPISRYIYGINPAGPGAGLSQPSYSDLNLTLERLGGNRWTAYNWKNNASNAGNDWHFSNDNFLDPSTEPGDAPKAVLSDAAGRGAAAIVTVPINGYVAADESGPVPQHVAPENSSHFVPEFPSVSDDPHPAENHVYQDQFVKWVEETFPRGWRSDANAHPIFFMLDNEPDLWASTHPEVHPGHPTYAEIVRKSIAYASAIKHVAPDALVFGPASYGWNGFMTFQDAKDAAEDNAAVNPDTGRAYGDFLSYYLAQMKMAELNGGKRLLDMLDLHWYPEAMGTDAAGNLKRIDSSNSSPGIAAARMNAPRSLWDESYVEKSWITKDSTRGKPIALLPRLNQEIADNYPGTKLSISEYNYGGGNEISGGVAEADVLGLLGKYHVYAAAEWPMGKDEKFILGAMRMFRNYDGKGGAFGDVLIPASTSDPADTSIYASSFGHQSGQLVLVAINRTDSPLVAQIKCPEPTGASITVFQLTSSSAQTTDGSSAMPTLVGTFPIAAMSHYTMPARSVSTLIALRAR
jgi:hypothetical protein